MEPARVPTQLAVGSFEVARVSHQALHAVTYSDYDPIDVPLDMLALLPHFDGRPTDEVLARFREETGKEVAADVLRKLVDYDVLVPSDPLFVCR